MNDTALVLVCKQSIVGRMQLVKETTLGTTLISLMSIVQVLRLFAYRARLPLAFDVVPFWLMVGLTIVVAVAINFVYDEWFLRVTQQGRVYFNDKVFGVRRLSLLAGIMLLGYSFFRPISGDESGSVYVAQYFADAGYRAFFTNYSTLPWVGNQHPPLQPILNGTWMGIFGGHPWLIRLTSILSAVGVLSITYQIGKQLFGQRIGFLSGVALLLFLNFYQIGSLGNNDMLVTFFFCLTLWLLFQWLNKPSASIGLFLAIITSAILGMLSKYTMVFIMPIGLSWLLLMQRSRPQWRYLIGLLFFVATLLFAVWIMYSRGIGGLESHFERLFFYAGAARRRGVARVFSAALRIPTGFGVYMLPLLFVGVFERIRARKRVDYMIFLWGAGIILPVLLTFPFERYMLPALPVWALIAGHGLMRLGDAKWRVVSVALFFCSQLLLIHALAFSERLPLLHWF